MYYQEQWNNICDESEIGEKSAVNWCQSCQLSCQRYWHFLSPQLAWWWHIQWNISDILAVIIHWWTLDRWHVSWDTWWQHWYHHRPDTNTGIIISHHLVSLAIFLIINQDCEVRPKYSIANETVHCSRFCIVGQSFLVTSVLIRAEAGDWSQCTKWQCLISVQPLSPSHLLWSLLSGGWIFIFLATFLNTERATS